MSVYTLKTFTIRFTLIYFEKYRYFLRYCDDLPLKKRNLTKPELPMVRESDRSGSDLDYDRCFFGSFGPDDFLPIPFMEREIRFLPRSTPITRTSTTSPTLTTSMGFLTKRSDNWLIWTSPSWWTPISTNAPKSDTLRTVPIKSIPSSRSFSSRIPVLKIGSGNSSLGSRPGLTSSF